MGNNKGKKPITIYFTDDSLAKLDSFCEEHFGADRSKVVMTSLEQFLKQRRKKND